MSRRIRARQGDIVVIVPRWLIIGAGLVMLLIELTYAFLPLFNGLIPEGIFFALAALVLAPLQILILYIVWRFYWYFLILSTAFGALMMCALFAGVFRVAGVAYAGWYGPNGAMGALAQQFFLRVGLSFLAALLIVVIVASLIQFFIGPVREPNRDYDIDEEPRRRKQRPRDMWRDKPRNLPHPHDSFWDDE